MAYLALKPSQELIELVSALGGFWRGYVATCRCPAHRDRTPSLSLRQGDRGILVTCFAGCAAQDILRELRRLPRSRRSEPLPAPPSGRTGNAARLWGQARAVEGTLAERYLRRRRLEPGHRDLRFHPRCPLGPGRRVVYRPTLLVAVRETHDIVAVQRIVLDPASAGYERKTMLGQPGAGAWQGGLIAEDTLAIAEGFETAAAFTKLYGVPCWASLGARRLDRLLLPSAVTMLLIAQDNDPPGEAAAARAEVRYARPGLSIKRAPPPRRLKDWAVVLEREFERGGGSGG